MYANYLALNGITLNAARCGPTDLRETVPLPRVQHIQNKGILGDLKAFWLPPPRTALFQCTNANQLRSYGRHN
jgi:hypothetical protein